MSELSRPSRREFLAAGSATVLVPQGRSAPSAPPETSGLPHAKPEDIGLSPRRLQVAYKLLEGWTKGKNAPVPGGAILVGRNGKIVPPRFFGRQGPEPDATPMRPDSMFLLASITKPLTYLGAMLLVEQGKLNLSDPVIRYVPEFAKHDKKDTLVAHLFTHTSGMPDMLPDNVELRRKHSPLKTFIEGAINSKPLFAPGTQLSYQSMGTLVVAEIIQRLSGMSIHEYLRKNIFEPLGLKSIGLGSKGFESKRLVRVQVPEWQNKADFGWNSKYWQELGVPWGGAFSSPEDFAVICELMLQGGTWQKIRLLSKAAVKMMTTNRLNDYPELPELVRRTQPWGLGWRMNHPGTRGSWSDLLGRHVFGHTGSTGTMVWMNPETRGFCLIWTSAIRARAPWRLVHLSNVLASAFL